ncbi:MAG: Gfo/Idh/MocA family oxidoreductase [Acidobacteria bacterium]|nr:Gfo/Idh/MocA family oxidoreductase [Acidobacteriota bacterium]
MPLSRDRRIKAGIVGYGRMGKIRGACLGRRNEWELIGICDIQNHGMGCDVPVFREWSGLLSAGPDAVFVCTPNRRLPEVVMDAVSRGIHVFCEKPPGCTLEDVIRMREAEAAHPGVKLKFGFNHRYHAAVQDAKAIVDSGRLGRVMWVRGIYGKAGGSRYDQNWRNRRELSGGGILIDQGIHMLDLFRLFCDDFEEVKSFLTRSYWTVEVEDNAFVLLRNSRGQVAMLHSSATQWQHRFMAEIYLERGYLAITGILSSTRTYGRETLRVARCQYDAEGYPQPNPEETITYYDEDRSWEQEIDDFARSILEDRPVTVGGSSDAYQVMSLVQQIYTADPLGPRSAAGELTGAAMP